MGNAGYKEWLASEGLANQLASPLHGINALFVPELDATADAGGWLADSLIKHLPKVKLIRSDGGGDAYRPRQMYNYGQIEGY